MEFLSLSRRRSSWRNVLAKRLNSKATGDSGSEANGTVHPGIMFSVFPIKGNTFELLGAFHSTKTFKNLKTGVNGTGIAGKSFQKFRKLNANHSTENSRNSESKVNGKEPSGKKNFRKFGYTSRGCPLFTKSLKTLFHSFLP